MRRIHWVTGLACGALAASPWFTWMWLRFGDRFVQEYFIAGNLWYFTKPPVFSTKTTSDTYYLRVFTGGVLPLEPDRDRARRRTSFAPGGRASGRLLKN